MFLCQIVFIMNTSGVNKCFKHLIISYKLMKFRIVELWETLIGQVLTVGSLDLKNGVAYLVKASPLNYLQNL